MMHPIEHIINWYHKLIALNHPPGILRQTPLSIENKMSTTLSTKEIFKQAIPTYKEALQKTGYKYNPKYKPRISD